MTVSLFPNFASASDSVVSRVAIDYELVRGSETRLVDELLPLVQHKSVELDLSAVERIDAAGIAALITLYCTASEAGTGFSVVSASQRVLDLLNLVGLASILTADRTPDRSTDAAPCESELAQSAA